MVNKLTGTEQCSIADWQRFTANPDPNLDPDPYYFVKDPKNLSFLFKNKKAITSYQRVLCKR